MAFVAPIVGAMAAIGGAVAANVQQNKARHQAREQMRRNEENFKKDLALRQTQFNTTLQADTVRHNEQMTHLRNALAQNQSQFAAQLEQADRGMQAQQAAEQQARNAAEAQLQRRINMEEASSNIARYDRKEKGVAGTILTGPAGVDEEEMKHKINRKTLLGQ